MWVGQAVFLFLFFVGGSWTCGMQDAKPGTNFGAILQASPCKQQEWKRQKGNASQSLVHLRRLTMDMWFISFLWWSRQLQRVRAVSAWGFAFRHLYGELLGERSSQENDWWLRDSCPSSTFPDFKSCFWCPGRTPTTNHLWNWTDRSLERCFFMFFNFVIGFHVFMFITYFCSQCLLSSMFLQLGVSLFSLLCFWICLFLFFSWFFRWYALMAKGPISYGDAWSTRRKCHLRSSSGMLPGHWWAPQCNSVSKPLDMFDNASIQHGSLNSFKFLYICKYVLICCS